MWWLDEKGFLLHIMNNQEVSEVYILSVNTFLQSL